VGCPDAAAALALATALAESALESEREEHTPAGGPGEHTPAHLYDFDVVTHTAPLTTSPALVMATGATTTTTAAARQLLRGRP
jgi:hypothetical protein